MKNKQFAIFSLSVLILLALVSFASATAIATATITGTSEDTFSIPSSIDVEDKLGNIAQITLTPTSGTIPAPIKATITSIENGFGFGSFTKTISAGTNATLTVKVENNPCNPNHDYDTNGNFLDLSVENVKVVKGFGEENEWYPLDEVEVRVTVENKDSDDIKSIQVEWQLYDKENQIKIDEGELDKFNLDEGDEKDLVIQFILDNKISKFASDGDYELYIWAIGRAGEDTSIIDGEDKYICSSTTIEDSGESGIELQLDDSFVVIDSVSISESVSCGSQIEVTGKAWNIGEEDEEDVYFKAYNAELKINQKVELGDIDKLDSKDFTFTLNIPAEAEEKDYVLDFYVYDDSDDIFENDNDDQSRAQVLLSVTGGCSTESPAFVTANLESEAVAGKELIIKSTVTNTDSKTNTFTLGLDEYSSWASLDNIDKTSLTLNAGESQEVVIKLKVNSDALGDQKFNIVVKDGEKVLSQPISVSIAKPSFGFSGLFSGLAGNSYLYGIIGLNVLLVFIIVFVAIKMSKKKKE